MNKRQESAINTRKKLVECGLKLIEKKGIENVKVEDITKEAGVAKGSFYVYFKNKEELLLESAWGKFKRFSQDAIDSNKDIISRLKEYCLSFINLIVDGGIEMCRSWVACVVDPNKVDGITKVEFDEDNLKKILKDAVNKKELKEDTKIDLLTYEINSLLYGLMIIWAMSRGGHNPKEKIEDVYENQIKPLIEKEIN